MKTTQEQKQLLIQVYLQVYDNHSARTSDVMEQLNLSRSVVLKALKQLQSLGLVVASYLHANGTMYQNDGHGRRQTPGKETIWQCIVTYDDETNEQALARVQAALC